MVTRRSREEILQTYRALRAELGRAPGKDVLLKRAGIKPSEIRYYWPRPKELALEAGAPPNTMQAPIADADVFSAYARVCLHLDKIPTNAELRIATRELKTPTHTVAKRFGTIQDFDRQFRNWLEAQSDPKLLTILGFPGWDRSGGRLGPARRHSPTPGPTPPIRPFVPAGLQGIESLSRGERPPFADLTAPISLLFERRVADAFRCLGFEVREFGQGTGRKADCLALARAEGFAVIIDAKARQDTYVLGTEDRKFLEYATTHADELRGQGITRVYFVVVAASFRDSDVGKLQNTLTNTSVRRGVFLTVDALLRRVENSIRERYRFSLRDLEKELSTTPVIAA